LGHVTRKVVSEMTYNVWSGTLNPTIQYYTIPLVVILDCELLSVTFRGQGRAKEDAQHAAHGTEL